VTPFALGILNLVQKAIVGSQDGSENRIEWIASLLMQVWFVLLWISWRRTGFRLDVRTR